MIPGSWVDKEYRREGQAPQADRIQGGFAAVREIVAGLALPGRRCVGALIHGYVP
jgi:hypothetical protein